MKERAVTLACALGALALFATLFVRVRDPLGRPPPRPTSVAREASGYAAAAQWLRAQGIAVISLRQPFGAAGQDTAARIPPLPAQGNLLVTTLPTADPLQASELASLARWVRAGNTLLVFAALADAPEWTRARAALTPADLQTLSGLGVRRLPAAVATARTPVLLANGEHPWFRGVRTLACGASPVQGSWRLDVPYDGFALELAHERASGAGALWVRPQGAGRIIVSACASLIDNADLGRADNAALLANIVATSVGAHGAVLFDDAHQGLTTAYDPQRFYRDPRLYATIAVLLCLWLAWVLGGTRLAAPVPPSAPQEAQLMEAAGQYLARVLPGASAARALIEHFLARTAARAPAGAWTSLAQHPRIHPRELEQLQRWYATACAGRRVPLAPLQGLLMSLERRLRG